MRFRLKAAALTGAAASLAVFNAQPAFAGDVYGAVYDLGVVNGLHYYNRAFVSTNNGYPNDPYARTNLSVTTTMDAGDGGVTARLWKGDAICGSTNTFYNDENGLQTISIATGFQDCGAGTYHSKGISYEWQGNSYKTNYTHPTPNQTYNGA